MVVTWGRACLLFADVAAELTCCRWANKLNENFVYCNNYPGNAGNCLRWAPKTCRTAEMEPRGYRLIRYGRITWPKKAKKKNKSERTDIILLCHLPFTISLGPERTFPFVRAFFRAHGKVSVVWKYGMGIGLLADWQLKDNPEGMRLHRLESFNLCVCVSGIRWNEKKELSSWQAL